MAPPLTPVSHVMGPGSACRSVRRPLGSRGRGVGLGRLGPRLGVEEGGKKFRRTRRCGAVAVVVVAASPSRNGGPSKLSDDTDGSRT